jgi:phosphoglycerate dehydrogenase-like enzyme
MVSAGIDEFPSWLLDVERVTCGRGTNSVAIAEFVLASMLAVEKRFPRSWISGAAEWKRVELGLLQGKTLGLLGFGSIGRAIAKRALAFEMRVLACRRTKRASDLAGVDIVDVETVLCQADHLIIAMPLTGATRRQVDAAALTKVKPGVHLVNISRGAILDQDALIAALNSGRVGAASLDVSEPEPLPNGHPLYEHPAVHISPHISWIGSGPADSLAVFTENLRRFHLGTELINRVDASAGY